MKVLGEDISSIIFDSQYHYTKSLEEVLAPTFETVLPVVSGLVCSSDRVVEQFYQPSLASQCERSLCGMLRPSINSLFSITNPVLGPGILVSKSEGKALITLVPTRENSVLKGVASDVVNGSYLLDITLAHQMHDTLYLAKENETFWQDDLKNLLRLSGQFNISFRDGPNPELKATGVDSSLVIFYGNSSHTAKLNLILDIQQRVADDAWRAEVQRVRNGEPGLYTWSENQKSELLRNGKVSGYIAAELHPVERFPLLIDDASNIVFIKSEKQNK